MSGKWQPGDVALVRNEYNVWNVAICAVRRGRRGFVWSYGVADSESPIEADARPLAVIDPEGNDVNRLIPLLGTAYRGTCDQMRAALREFADPKPLKPKEPTGLGAVVRERHEHDGVDWVRVPLASNDERWFCGDTGEWRAYADIDAVKVLSEGVTP